METIRVNMTPCEDIKTIHASQNDNEAREWGFELHNNGEKIDSSSISDQLVFKAYEGGTEELLPSSLMNGSVDLGSLTWTLYGANNHEFTAEFPNMKVCTTNASIPSLWVNAVANYSQWVAQRPNDSLYKDTNGKLHLRLNPYTTVAELTNALQGVYLWYEKSDSTPTTTPFLGDIKYPQGLLTNQEFTYRESPTEEDGLANIVGIKGQTLKWNQFCCKGRYFTRGNNEWQGVYTENGVTFTYLDDYTVRITGTPTARTYIYLNRLDDSANYPVKQGEKLLLRCSNAPNGIDIFSSLYNDSTWKGAGPQKSDKYVTVPSDVNKLVCMGIDVQASLIGQTIDVTVSLNVFNLTKMFGSGNEPTEEEFNALFPLYYSYNAGSLLSFNGTGIKTANEDESEEHTTILPISTYFPTGMKSAGSVYDELTETKAITRIGSVDLGTITYTYDGECFIGQLPSDAKVLGANTETLNSVCDKYLINNWSSVKYLKTNMTLGTGVNRYICIFNSSYTDPSAFKTAMSGVYLYYELATPTETSFATASLVTENAEIPLSNEDGVLIGKCTEQLSVEPGFHDAKIKLADEDGECYSNKIQLHIERSPQ